MHAHGHGSLKFPAKAPVFERLPQSARFQSVLRDHLTLHARCYAHHLHMQISCHRTAGRQHKGKGANNQTSTTCSQVEGGNQEVTPLHCSRTRCIACHPLNIGNHTATSLSLLLCKHVFRSSTTRRVNSAFFYEETNAPMQPPPLAFRLFF
jgi:hypothetical protein